MVLRRYSLQQMYLWLIILIIVIVASFYLLLKEKSHTSGNQKTYTDQTFLAPGKDWKSPKKVEDYFVERLHMSPDEAAKVRTLPGADGKITLRLLKDTKLQALTSNLEYYGFVRDHRSLESALEQTVDTVPGHQEALKVGNNTIDLWASYRISEDMTTWEIADQLLNHPNYFAYDEYGYMFMP